MAWAFTRLRLHGVCRYQDDVDEVISPRFIDNQILIIINFKS